MLECFYRILQRSIVLEGVAILVGKTDEMSSSIPSAHDTRVMSVDEMKRYVKAGQAPYCEELIERHDNEQLWCFGNVEKGELRSFVWLNLGGAEASMNKGYCESTATAIELSDNAAFVFHAYTATTARGQGRMPALLSAAAETLRRRAGIAYVVGTTELTNRAALSAFASAGIKKTASYWRCGVGKWAAGWYPKPAPPVVKFGD